MQVKTINSIPFYFSQPINIIQNKISQIGLLKYDKVAKIIKPRFLLGSWDFTMRCILFHPAMLPLHTQLSQRQQLLGTHATKLAAAPAPAPHRQQHLLSLRTKAIQNAVTFLGVDPSAKSGGDISVLLQTGYLFSHLPI